MGRLRGGGVGLIMYPMTELLAPIPAPPLIRPLTRAEKAADAAVHATGVTLALMGAPALIVLAALLDGRAELIAAVSVYGASLLAMLGLSGAYNTCPDGWDRTRAVLRRLDHAAIYVKIAGTQTPFAILVGGTGGWALTLLWLGALGGVMVKLVAPHFLPKLSVLFYLGLGWAGTSLLIPGVGETALNDLTVGLMVAGGALYTVGVAFFLWERLPFNIAIWHGFVLVATCVFYSAVTLEVSLRAAVL